MKRTAESALFFGAFINLGMAITAIVFMSILIHNNTGKSLENLEELTIRIEDNITTARDGVSDAQECADVLEEQNATLVNCTDVAFAECANLTDAYVASVDNLSQLTVESLNATLSAVVESCANRTSALRARIAEVAMLSGTSPTLLDSGFSNVMVDGAAALLSAEWRLYRIDGLAGSDLQLDFVVLQPWVNSVRTSNANPEIVYDAFPFLSDLTGTRFLLTQQQQKWAAGGSVIAWGGNLKFYTNAPTGGSFQLVEPLSIL